MTQITIFDEAVQPLVTENDLTPRQWRLYELFKANSSQELKRKEILEMMDAEYQYSKERTENPKREFINLSCARELNEDIQALKKSERIQKVFVGLKLATNENEAVEALKNLKASILKKLSIYHTQVRKLSLHGQTRLRFNQERPIWESILTEAQHEL